MQNVEQFFKELYNKADTSNRAAIGYPVNRIHAFPISSDLLGIREESFATTYLNNIASPYEYGTYVSGHIKELEIKLVAQLAEHFNLDPADHFGYITYGSSEANLAAIWWHRKYLTKQFDSNVTLMCSEHSHYSFKKIADILGLNLIYVEASEYMLNLTDLEHKLQQITSPVIFVTNFGNTVYGAIDDILAIHKLLVKYKPYKFKIHGDGAIYGLMIPYMKEYAVPNSMFELVDTLSFSGHKFLGSYSICGAILTKRSYLNQVFEGDNVQIGFIQKAIDITIAGSRQGFYAAELYLLLQEAFKYEGSCQNLEVLWQNCLELSEWFASSLKRYFPQSEIIHNQLRVVFPAPSDQNNTDFLGRKYGLMPIGNTKLGIYVFPRVTKMYLEEFIADYRRALTF